MCFCDGRIPGLRQWTFHAHHRCSAKRWRRGARLWECPLTKCGSWWQSRNSHTVLQLYSILWWYIYIYMVCSDASEESCPHNLFFPTSSRSTLPNLVAHSSSQQSSQLYHANPCYILYKKSRDIQCFPRCQSQILSHRSKAQSATFEPSHSASGVEVMGTRCYKCPKNVANCMTTYDNKYQLAQNFGKIHHLLLQTAGAKHLCVNVNHLRVANEVPHGRLANFCLCHKMTSMWSQKS